MNSSYLFVEIYCWICSWFLVRNLDRVRWKSCVGASCNCIGVVTLHGNGTATLGNNRFWSRSYVWTFPHHTVIFIQSRFLAVWLSHNCYWLSPNVIMGNIRFVTHEGRCRSDVAQGFTKKWMKIRQWQVLASPPTASAKVQIQLQQVGFESPYYSPQPAFIEWQSTIHRSPPPLQILGQKSESNHSGDSMSHQ